MRHTITYALLHSISKLIAAFLRPLQKYCYIMEVFGLGFPPETKGFLLARFAPGLESHLKRVRFDDEQRVGLVYRHGNNLSSDWVLFMLQSKAPCECSTCNYQLILCEGLPETFSLAPTERRHPLNPRIGSQRFLVGGPFWLQPSFRAIVVWVRIFDGVAKESPANISKINHPNTKFAISYQSKGRIRVPFSRKQPL